MPDTTCHMSISLDGFVAGPDQSRENPLGKRGGELHRWHLGDARANDADKTVTAWLMRPRGAYVMGRNMFGPIRGKWPDENWKGWWGSNPPYHVPVFVLTHHARAPLVMEGGTTFHFVTDGIQSALQQAQNAASGKDIRVGGGVSTVRQYLSTRLLDEIHLAMAPVFLGTGENLFVGLDLPALGYSCTDRVSTPAATHLTVTKLTDTFQYFQRSKGPA